MFTYKHTGLLNVVFHAKKLYINKDQRGLASFEWRSKLYFFLLLLEVPYLTLLTFPQLPLPHSLCTPLTSYFLPHYSVPHLTQKNTYFELPHFTLTPLSSYSLTLYLLSLHTHPSLQSHWDLEVSSSQAKIDENFANYFLKTKANNKCSLVLQKSVSE